MECMCNQCNHNVMCGWKEEKDRLTNDLVYYFQENVDINKFDFHIRCNYYEPNDCNGCRD